MASTHTITTAVALPSPPIHSIQDSLDFIATLTPQIEPKSISSWASQAGKIWQENVCVEMTPVDESHHRCEDMQSNFDGLADQIKQQIYYIKAAELELFFKTHFGSIQFFAPDCSAMRRDYCITEPLKNSVHCTAVVADVLSIPVDQAIAIIREYYPDVKCRFDPSKSLIIEFWISIAKTCKLVVIPFEVRFSLAAAMTATTVATQRDRDQYTHVCLPNVYCPLEHHPSRADVIYTNSTDLYGCLETGLLHMCGLTQCDIKIASGEGNICRRTGMLIVYDAGTSTVASDYQRAGPKYERRENVHWAPLKYVSRVNDPTAIVNMSLEDVLWQENLFGRFKFLLETDSSLYEIHNKKSTIKDKKMLYIITAMKKILALLSDERIQTEKEQKQTMQQSEIERELNRFEGRHTTNRMIPDIITYMSIIMGIRNKKDNIIGGTIDDDTKRKLALTYAGKCVMFWWIILTKTEMGRRAPLDFSFHAFVLASLMIFTDGFVIPDRHYQDSFSDGDAGVAPMIRIVEPDAVLQTLSIVSAIIAYGNRFQNGTGNGGGGDGIDNAQNTTNTTTTQSNKSSSSSRHKQSKHTPTTTKHHTTTRRSTNGILKKTRRQQEVSRDRQSKKRKNPQMRTTSFMDEKSKKKVTGHTINTMKKQIENALLRAINSEEVMPETLKLSNYTLDDVDPEIFFKTTAVTTTTASQK